MPLIPQQDIITVRIEEAVNGTLEPAVQALKQALESYPPVRIVCLVESVAKSGVGFPAYRHVTAVIETV